MINLLVKICSDVIIEELLKLHKPTNFRSECIDISRAKNFRYGHFQLNDCIFLSKMINNDIFYLYTAIARKIRYYFSIFDVTVYFFKPCFINFKISNYCLEVELKKRLFNFKVSVDIEKRENIFLDYSSPNIAKEMHVGHLRSTIIGDFFANLFKFVGHKIIKVSHLGDWGTQFGMLINYLKVNIIKLSTVTFTLKKLDQYYKTANQCFLKDELFRIQSKKEVVKLQNNETNSLFIWTKIARVSRREYDKIYKLLGITISYKGESFYKALLNSIVVLCEKRSITTLSDGAICIYVDGFLNVTNQPLPVIIKKSDGGFNYATTEIASIYYRIKYHNPDKIIYVTDIGQKDHFSMIFKIIDRLNIKNNKTKLIHIPFGLMLDSTSKKIKTRSGESEKLKVFIRNSINYVKKILDLKKVDKSILPQILAINTIKYADLSNKLEQNYIFNYDKLLKIKGNTAMFLMYAYARIYSIKRKSLDLSFSSIKRQYDIILIERIELDLALDLLQYNYIIFKTINKLDPTILTAYLYNVAEKFHSFFHACNVINSEYKYSRLLLCEIVRNILYNGFRILGIKPVNKI